MKKLLLALAAGLLATMAEAHPQDGMTPEQLMHYYVAVFNAEDLAALQDVYHFPHVQIRAGKLALFSDRQTPAIDFDALKKSGWHHSSIDHVKVLAEGDNAALVELRFTRHDSKGRALATQTGFYHLTKNNGYWQIIGLNNTGPLTERGASASASAP